MSVVMDTPEHIAYVEYAEMPAIPEERPQARRARPGFWSTVVQYVTRHCTLSASRISLHPMETPADLLARHYPTLYIQAYAGQ